MSEIPNSKPLATVDRYPSFFFIRHNSRNEKIKVANIKFIEACKNYTKIHTKDIIYMQTTTMKQYEEFLSPADFVRIHRGYIVSFHWVQSFDQHHVYGPGIQLPIGEMYRDVLSQSIVIIKARSTLVSDRRRRTCTVKHDD